MNLMKSSGKCPKCGSTNIVGPLVKTMGAYRVSRFRLVRMVGYVCENCGYVEDHVEKKGMKHIRRHFEKRTYCPNCGGEVGREQKRCYKCDLVLVQGPLESDSQQERKCPKCGSLQSYGTSLCFECGESLTD